MFFDIIAIKSQSQTGNFGNWEFCEGLNPFSYAPLCLRPWFTVILVALAGYALAKSMHRCQISKHAV